MKRIFSPTMNVLIMILTLLVYLSWSKDEYKPAKDFEVIKTEKEWRAQLTDSEYHVAREQGTERAFTGRYWNNKKEGNYHCIGCDKLLFSSKHKFKSGTGWPSYYDVAQLGAVLEVIDKSYGMTRTEVVCNRCGSHLGHLFPDGPAPTGLRYCINSVSLKFKEGSVKP